MGEWTPDEPPARAPVWSWVVATLVVCALFWGGLYLAALEPLREELDRYRAAQARAEEELPTTQAERQLAETEKELAALLQRWETTTAAALGRQLEAHSVTLQKAQPGEEAGTFVLDVEGSAHGLGLALPGMEGSAAGGRLPAVLYFRHVKVGAPLRARMRVNGAGRLSDWTVAPAEKE